MQDLLFTWQMGEENINYHRQLPNRIDFLRGRRDTVPNPIINVPDFLEKDANGGKNWKTSDDVVMWVDTDDVRRVTDELAKIRLESLRASLNRLKNGNTRDRWRDLIFIAPNEVEHLSEKNERLELLASLELSHRSFLHSELGKKLKSNCKCKMTSKEFKEEIIKAKVPFSAIVTEGRRGK